MILIADSGSTKCDWALLSQGSVVAKATTTGINPYFTDTLAISKIISTQLIDQLPKDIEVSQTFFYGAGCTPQKVLLVHDALAQHFDGKVEVMSDMLGAARALCYDAPGIVGILGTGANSCYYNGKEIVANQSPLGYIIGDEGSGAMLGKLLLGFVLKTPGQKILKEALLSEYHLTTAEIIERLYRGETPNRFLASFAPFIHKYLHYPEIYQLVSDAFSLFIERNIAHYPEHHTLPIHFCGSIAYHFQDVLQQVCNRFALTLGKIIQAPMDGLLQYHS